MKAVLARRHVDAREPELGYVFLGSDSGHVSYSTVDSQHGRTVGDINVRRFRMYDLKHTAITRLGEAGADPFTIQKIAGPASILISQRYVHPTPERLEDAFSRLEEYNLAKQERLERQEQQTG